MRIYLVGGTTPRTDLDNYQAAFTSLEEAEKCRQFWQKEQGEYEYFHIDSIEVWDKWE